LNETLHNEVKPRRDARPWLLVISLLAIVLDRVTKNYVAKHIYMGSAVEVIPKVFRITHVLNTGAAFSMFADSASPVAVRIALVSFSVIAAVAVLFMLWRYGKVWSASAVGFALVLGGAVGNLYDRAVYHYVVDFLEVHIVHYHFPDFNVADSCITVGAVLLVAEMIWGKPASEQVSESASQLEAADAGDVRGA
jgi:signal peptidase II